MKKIPIFIVVVLAIGLFAWADYRVSSPDLKLPTPSVVEIPSDTTFIPASDEVIEGDNERIPAPSPSAPSQAVLTSALLDASPELSIYELSDSSVDQALFDRFDLSQTNLVVYKHTLSSESNPPISIDVYELPGAAGQGRFNFLTLKLTMTTALNSNVPLNQTDDYGQASLFYNNENQPENGFLLVQINDKVFGFGYPKDSENAFKIVQTLITTLNNS